MSSITVATATPEVIDVIDRWHRFMRGDMPDALDGLLDDEVVLYSPVVFKPQRGKPIVAKYLSAAKSTFAAIGFDADTGPSFRYIKRVVSGDTAVLEFETEMSGKYVNGVDIIRVNRAGKIVEFRVMVRPLQALHAVHELMGAELVRIEAAKGDAPT
jgi:SnoaL-like protein